jgi:hypothetical protein
VAGGGGGGNGGVNGFNAIEDGGEVKRGDYRGSDGGVSNGSGRHPEVWSWAARGVASPREGGSKRAGRHRRMANWADRAAEWPRPSG